MLNVIKVIWIKFEQFVIDILDIAKKTIAVFVVLGYILLFLWAVIMTFLGWYFVGLQASAKGFITLCLCFGILLHISEKYKRSDDIGGESNEKNDTGLCEDSERS